VYIYVHVRVCNDVCYVYIYTHTLSHTHVLFTSCQNILSRSQRRHGEARGKKLYAYMCINTYTYIFSKHTHGDTEKFVQRNRMLEEQRNYTCICLYIHAHTSSQDTRMRTHRRHRKVCAKKRNAGGAGCQGRRGTCEAAQSHAACPGRDAILQAARRVP
jgi:hypothetical protein